MKTFSDTLYSCESCRAARRRGFCFWEPGMTILPRDSDVVGAAVLLAILLLTGIRAFM